MTHVCKLDITPAADTEFMSQTVIGLLPDAVLAETTHSACTTIRSGTLAAETGDNILLHIPTGGGFRMKQRGGQDVECLPGQVYVDPTEVPGVAGFHGDATSVFYVSIPRPFLRAATPGLNRILRNSAAMTPQWRLLHGYAASLHREAAALPPGQLARYAAHVQDLALMALDAEGEAREIAMGRGVRAARLRAMKAEIEDNLTNEALCVDWIAARQGISPRYIRALFADAGTSFGDYVASRRLLVAYRRLTDPSHSGKTISRIALGAGFGDLSWFNARFRRMFGMTPGDVRAMALSRPGD